MFSIPTLPKILLVAIVIAAVWWFFRRASLRARDDGDRGRAKVRKDAREARKIEDMVECAKCGAYVAVGSGPCGKEGCPIR